MVALSLTVPLVTVNLSDPVAITVTVATPVDTPIFIAPPAGVSSVHTVAGSEVTLILFSSQATTL